jgi:tetratricopeptide (TPR) repeat protein
LASYGGVLNWAGRSEEAFDLVHRAIKLNPIHPPWYLWELGHAYYLTDQFEKAIETFNELLDRSPTFLPVYSYLVAMYLELEMEKELQVAIAKLEGIKTHISIADWKKRLPYKDPKMLDGLFDALKKAGIE